MDVILMEKVDNLGGLGDKVDVRSGYGRNYLIPSGKAVAATKANLEVFETRRAGLEQQAKEVMAAAEARKAGFEALPLITIARKAGDEGRLFGSVGTSDIAELPEGPFHATGEFEVQVHLHSDVDAVVKLAIVPEA